MEKESLIVGTSNGLLFLHNVDDDFIEVVGRVEGGVKCISPSLDGDLLGIITGFGQILHSAALQGGDTCHVISYGSFCVVELLLADSWEELVGRSFGVEATRSDFPLGSFMHFVRLNSHFVLAVSHYGFSHSDIAHSLLSENGLHGFYLVEIEVICSEDCVPGSATSSGWHAKVSCQNSVEEQVIGIVPDPT